MIVFFIFILGLLVGSFLSVLIDRLPRGESPFAGRSHCDFCQRKLHWYDLIPLISFISLGGKCRYCKKFIGWKYPIVEITTAFLFILAFVFLPNKNVLSFFYYISIMSAFIVIFYSDLLYGIIPDAVIIPASLINFLYITLTSLYSLPYFLFAGLGAFFFFFFLFAITKGRGMGFGDVKLVFLLGFVLGYPKIIPGVYIAFLTGAIVAFILIICRKKKFFGSTIPFGPFLVLGTLASLFYGDFLIRSVLSFYF